MCFYENDHLLGFCICIESLHLVILKYFVYNSTPSGVLFLTCQKAKTNVFVLTQTALE